MANLYDISSHPLLTPDAQDLGSIELEAHARVAETLLGLLAFTPFDKTTDPDNYARATDAVALQVSYQVNAGMDAFILNNLIKGGRSMTFRGGRRMPVINGMAKKIVSSIKPTASLTTR